jgi:hypothetical protein
MKPAPQTNLVPQVINLIDAEFNNKFAPYQRMANVIIDLTRKNGDCSLQDLVAFGFTKQETKDLWHMAHAMANVELRLMLDKHPSTIKRPLRFVSVGA